MRWFEYKPTGEGDWLNEGDGYHGEWIVIQSPADEHDEYCEWPWTVTAYYGQDQSSGLPHERTLGEGVARSFDEARAAAEAVLLDAIAQELRSEAEVHRSHAMEVIEEEIEGGRRRG